MREAATVTFCGETSFSFGCFFFHAKLVKAGEWLAVMWQGASLCIIEICLQSRGGSKTFHRNKSIAITPNRVPFLISRRMGLVVQSGASMASIFTPFPLISLYTKSCSYIPPSPSQSGLPPTTPAPISSGAVAASHNQRSVAARGDASGRRRIEDTRGRPMCTFCNRGKT